MRLRSWALAATVNTFFLMLVGAWVTATGAGSSCPDWPTCNGKWVPPFENAAYTDAQILSEWFHRLLAATTTLLTIACIVSVRRHHKDSDALRSVSNLAGGFIVAQIALGALTVKTGNADWTVAAHQGLAILFFGVLVILTTLSWNRRDPTAAAHPAAPGHEGAASPEPPRRRLLETIGDYVALLKPRILLLLLVAALASMLIAVGTNLDPTVVAVTLVGGGLAAGAGNAFNQYLERDIDAMMARTARRPLPSGRLAPTHVLTYGVSLTLVSFALLAVFVNLLAAVLALSGAVFYVVVYTLWLKRTRPSNIVIGGAAGSFPALVGWAAVTGEVQLPALVLGFIVFLWTPPHFWAFALVYKEDYARANIPMLPVVRGDEVTKQQIFLYSIALFLCSTSLWLFGVVSDVYLVVSMVLSTLFVYLAFLTLRDPGTRAALRLFRYSILYLGLLFLSMAVDRLVFGSTTL